MNTCIKAVVGYTPVIIFSFAVFFALRIETDTGLAAKALCSMSVKPGPLSTKVSVAQLK